MSDPAIAFNWLKDLVVPFGAALIGGVLALLGSWITIKSSNKQFLNKLKTEREIDRKHALLGLKIEIKENLKALRSPVLNDYIYLSDIAWKNNKHLLSYFDESIVESLSTAYVEVGKIKNIVTASFTNVGIKIQKYPAVAAAAIALLESALKDLENMGTVTQHSG